MSKKALILVPHPSKLGGIASVYKTLLINKLPDIDYFYFNSSKSFIPKWLILFCKYIKFFFQSYKYDLIHVNPPINKGGFWRDIFFILIAIFHRKKIIIHVHGDNQKFYNKICSSPILKYLLKKTFGKADAIILLGHIFKEKYRKIGLESDNTFILPNPVDKIDDNINIEKSIDAYQKISLLFLSRIDHLKGTDIAIKTAHILEQEYPGKFVLNVCGDGPLLEEMKFYVEHKNIQNVFFHGYVTGKEKINFYLNSDIFLFPTHGEGLPVSILESFYFGMPVITRDEGGISDWVKNDQNGYVINDKDPDIFKDLILRLIQDPIKFNRISKNNIDIANENFLRDKINNSIISIYNSILDEKN